MFKVFRYEGQIIPDIRKWCKERNERLVHYRVSRKYVAYTGDRIITDVEIGSMPESFWDNLNYGNCSEYQILQMEDLC